MAAPKKPRHNNPFYQKVKEPAPDLEFPARLNKYIAKTGICSRRKAVDLIKDGKVSVNEVVQIEPFFQVEKNDIVKLEHPLRQS